MNGQYLTKPPEQVIEEIAQVPEPRIFLGDDHTFLDAERAAHFADLIAQKGIKKVFMAYSRADTIVKHPDLFRAWANVGLRWVTVGFESVSDEGLRRFNKGSTIRINEEANAILLRYGIHNMAHMLIDPSFTREDFRQVRNYTYELGVVHPVFPILTPLPGTDLWEEHADQVRGVERQYFDLAHPTLETRLLSLVLVPNPGVVLYPAQLLEAEGSQEGHEDAGRPHAPQFHSAKRSTTVS